MYARALIDDSKQCPICDRSYLHLSQKSFEEHVESHFNDSRGASASQRWDYDDDDDDSADNVKQKHYECTVCHVTLNSHCPKQLQIHNNGRNHKENMKHKANMRAVAEAENVSGATGSTTSSKSTSISEHGHQNLPNEKQLHDTFECSICNNAFDKERHRPRALPCGHGFCTSCMEKCISGGDKHCPVCRKNHGANSVSDLPPSYLLEELLQKIAISSSQKHKSDDIYAEVVRDGIRRCCKTLSESGRIFIPSLSQDVKPPSSARLIKEAELGLTSATTIVFFDLSLPGYCLGRVYIQVFGNTPHGQQFIMLVLRTDGPSFKGATFVNAPMRNDSIAVQEYLTESGLLSAKPLLTTLKKKSQAVVELGPGGEDWRSGDLATPSTHSTTGGSWQTESLVEECCA